MRLVKHIEPIGPHHPALEWAMPIAEKNKQLLDGQGRLRVPMDAVDYVTPLIGRPYARIRQVFLLDANGEPVLTESRMDVRRWPVDVKIKQPR